MILVYNFFIPSGSIGGILRSSWYSRLAAFLWLEYIPCAEATNRVLSLRSTRLTRTPLLLKILFSFHTFGIVVPTSPAISPSEYWPSEINSCMCSFLLGRLLLGKLAV